MAQGRKVWPGAMAGILAMVPLLGAPPRFTPADAVQAEWARQPLDWSVADVARLPKADRARLERTIRRIGAPGAPDLRPPEMVEPMAAAWEGKLGHLKTLRERVHALAFLNRVKSPRALEALDGLGPKDAARWPKHLPLAFHIASARLNGAVVKPELAAFLGALQKAGKVEPVRAQAARLRLVLGGKEQALLPPLEPTPHALMALLDAWNRMPFGTRRVAHLALFRALDAGADLAPLGLKGSLRVRPEEPAYEGFVQRLFEGLGTLTEAESASMVPFFRQVLSTDTLYARMAALEAAPKLGAARAKPLLMSLWDTADLRLQRSLLTGLWEVDRAAARPLLDRLLFGADGTSRAYALDLLPEPPTDLDRVEALSLADSGFDAQVSFVGALKRWKLPPETLKARLARFLEGPEWAGRMEAYRALKALDPATPWPKVPEPTAEDRALLKEAQVLATAGKPLRLAMTLSGKRRLVLALDPRRAPLNVAHLARMARAGAFDGRRIGRVVPDFCIQFGSPYDTMDGSSPRTNRCEDSLEDFLPGTVNMAHAGKDTGSCQVSLILTPAPHLVGKHTNLGRLEHPDAALRLLDQLELGARIERVEVLR